MEFFQQNIWFANQDHANSAFKWKAYNDIGDLSFDSVKRKLKFKGNNNQFEIGNNFNIRLGHQRLNWINYALIYFPGLLYAASIDLKLGFYTFLVLSLFAIFGIFIFWYLPKWIILEFQNEGQESKVFLTDGGYKGWSGLLGGNRKLYKKLKLINDPTNH